MEQNKKRKNQQLAIRKSHLSIKKQHCDCCHIFTVNSYMNDTSSSSSSGINTWHPLYWSAHFWRLMINDHVCIDWHATYTWCIDTLCSPYLFSRKSCQSTQGPSPSSRTGCPTLCCPVVRTSLWKNPARPSLRWPILCWSSWRPALKSWKRGCETRSFSFSTPASESTKMRPSSSRASR